MNPLLSKNTIDFDAELNLIINNNQRLKAKILSIIFFAILLVQIITFSILKASVDFNGKIFPEDVILYAQLFLLFAALSEGYAYFYLSKITKAQKNISPAIIYFISFLEISLPSFSLVLMGSLNDVSRVINISQLLNLPPVFGYFIMLILASLQLDFRLNVFVGIVGAVEYFLLTLYLLHGDSSGTFNADFIINLIKSMLLVAGGILSGFISQKIKEAILSSLKAKNELIYNLDKRVKEQTQEITVQKDIIEQKNKDITDSIYYARGIQQAILPEASNFQKFFPDSFILFKPKDIVSGDFYFFTETTDTTKTNFSSNVSSSSLCIIAAADCTGHGVPGALMSMLGNSFLNEIVNEKNIFVPAKILEELRKKIILAFKKEGSRNTQKDGMDIALCTIDAEQNILQYAGAFNCLWIIGNNEMHEVAADKFPIGNYDDKELKPFTNHTITLQKDDCIYLFTDGYADQFGGPAGKKFKYKPMKELMLSIHKKPMDEQKKILNETLENWQQDLEQVDDILVIGIRM